MPKKIRAIIRLLGIFVLATVLNIVLLLLPGMPKFRTKCASVFFRGILLWCGIKIQAELPPMEQLANKRLLIVANHVSYLDILVISSLHPCIFLAKSEVAHWPVFGWVARALGCVFVKRDSLMGRANALRASLRALNHSNLAIFPEGTTTASRTPDAASWAKGHAWLAKRSSIDSVLCLGLHFEHQNERAWTDEMSLIPHLIKTLGEEHIRIRVSGSWANIQKRTHTSEVAESTWKNVCAAVNHVCPQ